MNELLLPMLIFAAIAGVFVALLVRVSALWNSAFARCRVSRASWMRC